MFVSLTADNSRKEINAIARLAFIVATVIVVLLPFSEITSSPFLASTCRASHHGRDHFGINWLPHDSRKRFADPARSEKSVKDSVNSSNTNVAISPLAMPILAGPGTIATTMNLASGTNPFIVVAAFVVLAIIAYFIFIYGEQIMDKLGNNIMNVITKLMGLI